MKQFTLFLLILTLLSPFAEVQGSDSLRAQWVEQWEAHGKITKSHLQQQYDESITIFDQYRKKRDGEHGYDVVESFDPNETHIPELFNKKMPLLCGYAHQVIKKKFETEEQEKRLTALNRLTTEADLLNSESNPRFSLLTFKSLNLLVAFLMSQPDQRGDIWKYLIQDEIIYQYFKTATVDTISLPKYVNLVKARAQAVLLASTQQDTSLPSFTPQLQELTQWYYFVPYLAFEVFLYHPKSILPLEVFWRAHHHEVGVSVIGDDHCSLHGSTINNTLNLLMHDLFHWSRWVNRSKLNEQVYRALNAKLQTYLFSCITNPETGSVDSPQDLGVFHFLIHENFYDDVALDNFTRSVVDKTEMSRLFFGLTVEEATSMDGSSPLNNFKRFLGMARVFNAIKVPELTTKSIWIQKKLSWILGEVYEKQSVTISATQLITFSSPAEESEDLKLTFTYNVSTKADPTAPALVLHAKATVTPIVSDKFNLTIKVEPCDGNTDFTEETRPILNLPYTRKNYANDYYIFLGLNYPESYPKLPENVDADPRMVSDGLDKLIADFYERHFKRFQKISEPQTKD